jgi:recombination protein RecA
MREDLAKDLKKKYGVEVVTSGEHLLDKPKEIINFSPAFDIGIGGGIPKGSTMIFASPPKHGKTTSALSFCAKAQAKGMKVYYHDIEWRLQPRDLSGIKGLKLDEDSFELIRSKRGAILHAEDQLQIADNILNNETDCVVVLDSISALCSQEEFNADIGDKKRAPGAVLVAQFTKKISSVLPVNDNILISISHMIANTGGGYAGLVESGGNKIKFKVDAHFRSKGVEFLSIKEGSPFGQKVTWEVQASPIGGPKKKLNSFVKYGIGVDAILELMDIGVQLGFIEQAGAWYTFDEVKAQGQEKLYKEFENNQELVDKLHKQIYEAMGE